MTSEHPASLAKKLADARRARGGANLAVVVTCMGRLAFLRQSLPRVLGDGALAGLGLRYVLVDYSCPDDCGDWVRERFDRHYEAGIVRVVRVPGRSHFHKTEALNAGANKAVKHGAKYLCFLDADTLIRPGFGSWLRQALDERKFLVVLGGVSLTGFLAVPSAAFEEVGGYDEAIKNWGGEDIEMRLRLRLRAGLGFSAAPRGLLSSLPHDDRLRVRYCTIKNHRLSNRENFAFVYDKVREWTGREIFELDRDTLRLCGARRWGKKDAPIVSVPAPEPYEVTASWRRGLGVRRAWR